MTKPFAWGVRGPAFGGLQAHYVLDGDFVHPGPCMDEFLDGQIEASAGEHRERHEVWDALVECGAWTVTSREEAEYDRGDLEGTTRCLTCGNGIVLTNPQSLGG